MTDRDVVEEALSALLDVYDARDRALGAAVDAVYKRFATIVARREAAYSDALTAAPPSEGGSWSTHSGTGPATTGG